MLENWKTFKLIELYDISSGLSKSADEFGFGFPFLSFSTVFKNFFIPNELDQLVNTSIKEQATCSIQKGDVFLTRTSETIEELGMSCVALKNYPNATFNGFTKRLRPKNDLEIDPLFIGYYLRNVQFRGEISAYSTLTTRASLNNGIIEKLKVTVPPLPVQQKIASILSSYDELIENNKQRIQLLEEMAEEIYKEWFVRLRFQGYETAKIVDGLPEGWEEKQIDSFVKIISGYAFKTQSFDSDGIYKLVTIKNVQDGFFVTQTTDFIDELPKNIKEDCKLKDKDIILSLTGNIGRICMIYGENYVLNQRVAKLKPRKENYFEFAYLMFRSSFLRSTLENISNGAAQQNLSPIEMGKLEVVFPSAVIVDKFSEITKSFFDEIIILNKKNQLLQEARDLLLPRLISGKLSVAHLVEEELGMVAEESAEYNKTLK